MSDPVGVTAPQWLNPHTGRHRRGPARAGWSLISAADGPLQQGRLAQLRLDLRDLELDLEHFPQGRQTVA